MNMGDIGPEVACSGEWLYGYIMELYDGPMGDSSAAEIETDKMIVCLDRKDLENIWRALFPRRIIKVSQLALWVNRKDGLAVPMNSHKRVGTKGTESQDLFLVSEGEVGDVDRFGWPVGFAGQWEDSEAIFPEPDGTDG